MNRYSALRKLKNHPKLKRYFPLCRRFLLYLRDKENLTIHIEGFDSRISDFVYSDIPYIHKWRPEYRSARLAKFYKLDNWYKLNPRPLTMLTYTTYHDSNYSKNKIGKKYLIEDSWLILKSGFRRSSLIIRNKICKGISYF